MKKTLITVAAFGMLTGCTHFNPVQLHEAYQKTKDSYAFCKDAYKAVKADAQIVIEGVKTAADEVKTEWNTAVDEFHSYKTFDDMIK